MESSWTRPVAKRAAAPAAAMPPPPPAVLPADWKQMQTEQGHVYYYNTRTGESSWTPPSGQASTSAGSGFGEGDGKGEIVKVWMPSGNFKTLKCDSTSTIRSMTEHVKAKSTREEGVKEDERDNFLVVSLLKSNLLKVRELEKVVDEQYKELQGVDMRLLQFAAMYSQRPDIRDQEEQQITQCRARIKTSILKLRSFINPIFPDSRVSDVVNAWREMAPKIKAQLLADIEANIKDKKKKKEAEAALSNDDTERVFVLMDISLLRDFHLVGQEFEFSGRTFVSKKNTQEKKGAYTQRLSSLALAAAGGAQVVIKVYIRDMTFKTVNVDNNTTIGELVNKVAKKIGERTPEGMNKFSIFETYFNDIKVLHMLEEMVQKEEKDKQRSEIVIKEAAFTNDDMKMSAVGVKALIRNQARIDAMMEDMSLVAHRLFNEEKVLDIMNSWAARQPLRPELKNITRNHQGGEVVLYCHDTSMMQFYKSLEEDPFPPSEADQPRKAAAAAAAVAPQTPAYGAPPTAGFSQMNISGMPPPPTSAPGFGAPGVPPLAQAAPSYGAFAPPSFGAPPPLSGAPPPMLSASAPPPMLSAPPKLAAPTMLSSAPVAFSSSAAPAPAYSAPPPPIGGGMPPPPPIGGGMPPPPPIGGGMPPPPPIGGGMPPPPPLGMPPPPPPRS
eukprot:TRINITY_DN2798_c0_g1_i1.p1 TRINITY_DN2798_c0_g1~~TRINITY_DN2798_c0_g1_i1.p1  ORF type:complete len:695 (-),score=210.40 TRINITY_DN2798_c0_g1_i1:32-2035(-)